MLQQCCPNQGFQVLIIWFSFLETDTSRQGGLIFNISFNLRLVNYVSILFMVDFLCSSHLCFYHVHVWPIFCVAFKSSMTGVQLHSYNSSCSDGCLLIAVCLHCASISRLQSIHNRQIRLICFPKTVKPSKTCQKFVEQTNEWKNVRLMKKNRQ